MALAGRRPVLRLATTPSEIQATIREYQRNASRFRDDARDVAIHTLFWIYDPRANAFGPAKFVGFAGMTFPLRRLALKGEFDGVPFDGGRTHQAIERLLGPLVKSASLTTRLRRWATTLLGPDVFAGVDENKWRFVRLTGVSGGNGDVGAYRSDEPDTLERVVSFTGKGRGQGHISNPKERRAVEVHAMDRAKEYCRKTYSVEPNDTSKSKPYDLVCRLGKREIRLEVKGSKGGAGTVIVTVNEVRNAQTPRGWTTDLFILKDIVVRRRGREFVASGGREYVVTPWTPNNGDLKPSVYQYRVP